MGRKSPLKMASFQGVADCLHLRVKPLIAFPLKLTADIIAIRFSNLGFSTVLMGLGLFHYFSKSYTVIVTITQDITGLHTHTQRQDTQNPLTIIHALYLFHTTLKMV